MVLDRRPQSSGQSSDLTQWRTGAPSSQWGGPCKQQLREVLLWRSLPHCDTLLRAPRDPTKLLWEGDARHEGMNWGNRAKSWALWKTEARGPYLNVFHIPACHDEDCMLHYQLQPEREVSPSGPSVQTPGPQLGVLFWERPSWQTSHHTTTPSSS